MKKITLLLGIFFSLLQNLEAKESDYIDLTTDEEKAVTGFTIKRKINPQYIKRYEEETKKKYKIGDKIDPLYAAYYDPEYFIEYLEKIPFRTLAQKYQLLVLWQVYKPKKVHTEEYKTIAAQAHNKTMAYLADDSNWQASWRREEYSETIKDDFQKCYADTNCLLKAIPYWMYIRIPMDVILPCDLAKKHNLIYYLDFAAGGSGAQTITTSTCIADKKYDFSPELNKYVENTIYEKIPFSTGSIVNVFKAYAYANYLDIKYQPDFKAEKIEDWRKFPYTEWSVMSYYNFKKFKNVINYEIGYSKAVDLLKNHYIKTFNAKPDQALNAALIALNPPSSQIFKRITSNNLNYLLLTGASWEKIKKHLTSDINAAKLLELSIAHPQNLQQLLKLSQSSPDEPNEFGKTPLQTAAQYGYLESVKILLNAGADINHQTNPSNCYSDYGIECIHNGKRTALMYALQENQAEVAQYLLDNGADIKLTDSLEKTALDYLTKTAPIQSTHKLGSIYGGESSPKSEKDYEKIPQPQYEELYKKLFTKQHIQLADVLAGKWEQENVYSQKFFNGDIFIEKNTRKIKPLIVIKDKDKLTVKCYPAEDSHNDFSCYIKFTNDNNPLIIYYYINFEIAHYAYNDQLKILGIEQKKFKQCLNNPHDCSFQELGSFQRP